MGSATRFQAPSPRALGATAFDSPLRASPASHGVFAWVVSMPMGSIDLSQPTPVGV